jgi:FkbM family methyltransferase
MRLLTDFFLALIRPTRGITRALIQLALRLHWDSLALWMTHYAIAIYRRACPDPIDATYDNDIRVKLHLTQLMDANVYFLGMAGKDDGEAALLTKILRPDSIFVDIGGNLGQFALFAAKRVPQGKVHAFEPAPHNFARLQEHVQLNGFTNVVLNQAAVAKTAGTITIFVPRNYNSGAISIYPDQSWDADERIVPTIRLDDYALENQLARVDVIKLDIEGAELDALEGSLNMLRQHRPDVLMEATISIMERAGRSRENLVVHPRSSSKNR